MQYVEIPRQNRFPIIVVKKSPMLLYLFYEDYAFVYFGEDHYKIHLRTGLKVPRHREMISYSSENLRKEILLCTENGGKIIRYNEKYYYISEGKKQTPIDKYPIALIDKEGNIALLYRKYCISWYVRGEVYYSTYSDMAKETDRERYYSFHEEEMLTGNGYQRIGEEEIGEED